MTASGETPALFPISLHLHGKRCLVIGGDAVAETRVRALLTCEAVVCLVSPQVTPWLATLAQRGAIQWDQGPVQAVHFAAVSVVFVTVQEPQMRAQITTLAQPYPCLVHITDHPAQSDFSLPAVVRRGPLTLAISTAGQAPAFAAWLRKQLERLLDHRLGQVVEAYARLRPAMKHRYPDYATRARAWEELLTAQQPALFISPSTATDTAPAAPHQPSYAHDGRMANKQALVGGSDPTNPRRARLRSSRVREEAPRRTLVAPTDALEQERRQTVPQAT